MYGPLPPGYGYQQGYRRGPPPPGYEYPPPSGYGQGPPPAGYGHPPPSGYVQQQQGYGPLPPGYGQPPPPPVMQQPMPRPMGPPTPWAVKPPNIPPDCPPGLEYLSLINHVYVKQFVEPFEIATGYETANRYQVLNNIGQRMYLAMEESDPCSRQCMGHKRPFAIHLVDNMGLEVMKVVRRCQFCTTACCNEIKVRVEAPVNIPIGTVAEEFECFYDAFAIRLMSGQRIMSIRKSIFMCNSCGIVEFDVFDNKGNKCGDVKKLWGGIMKEELTDADTFGISFPVTLDIHAKALIIGACFLLDFMYFED